MTLQLNIQWHLIDAYIGSKSMKSIITAELDSSSTEVPKTDFFLSGFKNFVRVVLAKTDELSGNIKVCGGSQHWTPIIGRNTISQSKPKFLIPKSCAVVDLS
jgi:hypothetical protein